MVYSVWGGGERHPFFTDSTVQLYLLIKVLKQLERHKQVAWLQFQSPKQVRGAALPMSVWLEVQLGNSGKCDAKGTPFPPQTDAEISPGLSHSITVRTKQIPKPSARHFKELWGKETLASSQQISVFQVTSPNPLSEAHRLAIRILISIVSTVMITF